MTRAALVLCLMLLPLACFAQLAGGGIQWSGVLSGNLIDDFGANNAYTDTNAGYTYFQLTGSFKDGPFGAESQIQFGPSPAGSGVSNMLFHYGYGYVNFGGSLVYLAVGRLIDLSTFGLNSYFQEGPNGPGVYGNAVGKTGVSGFGIDGFELRIAPVGNLVFGIVMPFNINGFPIVNSTLRATRFIASYTFPRTVQLVIGYQQHAIDVADYVIPSTGVDAAALVGENKLYALANLLVSDNLTAGIRYELDHDVSTVEVISNNMYATLGGKIGNFSLGADAGIYVPVSGSAGMEILAAASHTFPSVLTSVDFQPYVQAGFFSGGYPLVTDLSGVSYTNGFTNDNYVNVNPQLKLLLGKSQHELVLGYSITFDMSTGQVVVNQLNLMIQIYF